MSIQSSNPHQENIRELLEMIREIGGAAAAFSAEDAAAFAARLASLPELLSNHTIIIGMIPSSSIESA